MKKLEKEFTKKGFDYKMISNTGNTFVFQKTRLAHTSFEVFEKRINPAREMHGVQIEASEAFPYDEAFGNWAFQCADMESAKERQSFLEERVKVRL